MEIIRCIVLEDEEPMQNLMKYYINKLSDVELVEVFDNALEVADFLENNSVDFIITDIEMPRLTGLDFIRMLVPRPPVIIITAYPDRANQAYDLDVVDYIVKPVEFERFKRAVEKVRRLYFSEQKDEIIEQNFIYVKENGKMLKLELSDIIYAEALADYVKIITNERTIITLSTFGKIEKSLPTKSFARVHKSFIINTNKIKSIDSADSLVTLNNKTEITLGRTYKSEFLAKIKSIN
ncbi:MAG: LytTR family DNA-binding domain-containing protein [Arcicella sp.]|nr:LytTR family DNA-binding domain-containing protein [Arcicella sp.]